MVWDFPQVAFLPPSLSVLGLPPVSSLQKAALSILHSVVSPIYSPSPNYTCTCSSPNLSYTRFLNSERTILVFFMKHLTDAPQVCVGKVSK